MIDPGVGIGGELFSVILENLRPILFRAFSISRELFP